MLQTALVPTLQAFAPTLQTDERALQAALVPPQQSMVRRRMPLHRH